MIDVTEGATDGPVKGRLDKHVVLYFELQLARGLGAIPQDEDAGEIIDYATTQKAVESLAHDILLPVNAMLERHVESSKIKIALAVSGQALELLSSYAPDVIDSLKRLNATDTVEWLALPYNNSLSVLVSDEVYKEEVTLHVDVLYEYFGVHPKTLLAAPFFSAPMVSLATEMGFEALLVKGDAWSGNAIGGDQSSELILLGTDGFATDAVMHRFGAGEAALTLEEWVSMINRAPGDTVVVGFPYEVFKAHQDAGVSGFFEAFLNAASRQQKLIHPLEYIRAWRSDYAQVEERPSFNLVSSSGKWLGTSMQRDALAAVSALDKLTAALLDTYERKLWLQLLSADHFARMSSEGSLSDSYLSPHDAFDHYNKAVHLLSKRATSLPTANDDIAPRAVEAERQHPTTPAWAVHEQSKYKEVTHSSI